MKRWIAIVLMLCLFSGLFMACSVPEANVQAGNTQVPQEEIGQQEETEESGFDGFADTSNDTFVYIRPGEEEMAAIEVTTGADFSTISIEALQGYWYCDEGYGYEIFLEVKGNTATIRETVDGITQEVWYGSGSAEILPPGESGWKNPGLDIRTEDGDSIAMLVLRRVGDGYFTTANSGVFYKIVEK